MHVGTDLLWHADNNLFLPSTKSLVCVLKPSCDGISSQRTVIMQWIESDNAVFIYKTKKFLCITTISSYSNDEEEKFESVLDDR